MTQREAGLCDTLVNPALQGASFAVAVQGRAVEPQWMLFPDAEEGYRWQNLAIPAPAPHINELEDIEFQLYTPDNPSIFQKVVIGSDSSLGKFDPSRKTVLVIHGYQSSGKKMDHIRSAYMTDMEVNCIIVNWSGIADGLYSSAKSHVVPVGNYLGKLLDFLADKGLTGDNVHLAGHSLGAHVAGVAGNAVRNLRVGRITALDPALPLYANEINANRVEKSDAAFVQVIHTCGGLLGWSTAIGHVDFFPNAGIRGQPGCGIDLGGACSHSRSHKFFGESISRTTLGFKAIECPNWEDFLAGRCYSNAVSIMGENTDPSLHGTFYLSTGSEHPFALG